MSLLRFLLKCCCISLPCDGDDTEHSLLEEKGRGSGYGIKMSERKVSAKYEAMLPPSSY